ncbi:MAG: phage terminase large subunit, partial [Lachnospiraceae bacterium]|nr:phage terminase large subunit [Lachnospiraceae bacterium]
NYTDTADEGADLLCSISGGQIGRYGYVTDVYYTDEPMEVTEPETARRLQINGVREALIESNNGGRGFARNVIRHLKELKCHKCSVTWFHQGKNKRTRILTNASNVMDQVIMPADWKERWPAFAKHVSRYQRKGKNDHDDAEDTLTGFVELINGDVKGKKKARTGKKSRLGL